MRRPRLAALAAPACLLALLAGGCGTSDPAAQPDDGIIGTRTLTVYASVPQEGPLAETGQDVVNATKLALSDAGGTAGPFAVNFVALDDATAEAGTWERDKVLENARKALQDSSAIAYLGPLHSGATALALPTLNAGGVPMVNPSATYLGFTEDGAGRGEPERFYPSGVRTFARVVPNDGVQAAAMAGWMRDSDVRRLHVLHDDTLYGRALAELTATAAGRRGVEVVAVDAVGEGEEAAGEAAEAVGVTDPDAVLLAADPAGRALAALRAAASAAPGALLYLPDALATPGFVEDLGGLEDRVRVTSPTLALSEYPPEARRFARRFRETFGDAPDPYAFHGYEAMKLVLAAIERAGLRGNDRQAVTRALRGIRREDTVLGDYAIDRAGDTTIDAYGAYRVRAAELVFDRVLDGQG